MYKIFINEYPLVITGNENDFYSGRNYRIVNDSSQDINAAMETLEKSDKNMGDFGLVVLTENADETFKQFSKRFDKITAAGGIIFNSKNEVLLIKRQGKWDLPKGKKDGKETVEDAAVREVKEECGLSDVSIESFCTRSYHTYYLEGKRILKTTHWYIMKGSAREKLVPQQEENITEVAWFDADTLDIENLDTYNSIKSVLHIALER